MGFFRSSTPQDRELAATTAKRTMIVYAVALGVTAVVYLLYLIRATVLQLVIALVLAVALEPLVRVFIRRKIKRVWAVSFAMVLSLSVLGVILGAVVTPLVSEGLKLSANAGNIADIIIKQSHLEAANERFHLVDRVKTFSQNAARDLTATRQPLTNLFGSIAGGAGMVTVIVVFIFFLLLEGPEGWRKFTKILRPEQAERLNRVGEKMMSAVGGFVSGNLLISFIAGTVTLITLIILRVPYAFALAVLLAIFDLIPLVGAAIGTIIIAVVALTQGVVTMLIAVAVLLVYQFVEGNVLQPIVYSRAIALSPFVIVLATVVGAELGGIVGVLLAIPVAAVLQIVVLEVFTMAKEPSVEPMIQA